MDRHKRSVIINTLGNMLAVGLVVALVIAAFVQFDGPKLVFLGAPATIMFILVVLAMWDNELPKGMR